MSKSEIETHRGLRVKPNKAWMTATAERAQRIASPQPVEKIPYVPAIKPAERSEMSELAMRGRIRVDQRPAERGYAT